MRFRPAAETRQVEEAAERRAGARGLFWTNRFDSGRRPA